MQTQQQPDNPPFTLNLIAPYTTFEEGTPKPIPYVIDGLLTQGGFSILAGKPKHGKSSMSRYEAVCVAKGQPFLGRSTTRGEVVLISLEDPLNHVDNCLKALGYDADTDARISIVDKLSPDINESLSAIRTVLQSQPDVRLVIVDTLAKLLRVKDMNDYTFVMNEVEKIHNLAREFPHLHIQGLVHCKKVKTDDPFDALLGSTALRGEPDTSIALYSEKGERVIATEARIGRNIDPTVLKAELIESGGADIVTSFSLDQTLSQLEAAKSQKVEKTRRATHDERIISFLQQCEGLSASQEHVLKTVPGKRELLFDAIQRLVKADVITTTGERQSPKNPTALHLNEDKLSMYDFLGKFDGIIE